MMRKHLKKIVDTLLSDQDNAVTTWPEKMSSDVVLESRRCHPELNTAWKIAEETSILLVSLLDKKYDV
jgi:hypothetical protein